MRLVAVSGACVALLVGVAACGGGGDGGGSKDRTALEAQLTKGPFREYRDFRGADGDKLSEDEAQKRLDCYADVLLTYGDKADVTAYEKSGKDYLLIGIAKPKDFKPKADACLGKENVSQYVPPYPAAALG